MAIECFLGRLGRRFRTARAQRQLLHCLSLKTTHLQKHACSIPKQGGSVADLDGLLPCSSSGGEGLRWGGELALGMAKKMESILHYQFTTLIASWKYSKWTNPSGESPSTVAATRTPLERV